MSGSPAFQATPHAFQDNAFQSGVSIVAGDYSLGRPVFATPALKVNYQLTTSAYSLGSPSFGTPPLGTAFIVITVNPYSLGSPTFSAPTLRSTQRFTAPAFSLGSPSFAIPVVHQVHRAAANIFALGSPDFGIARLIRNNQLSASAFSLGPLYFQMPTSIEITFGLVADSWSLSLKFGYPRLTVTPDPLKTVWPLTYHNAVEEAAAMLRTYLDTLLKAIPSTPMTQDRIEVRRLVSILRANAEAAIRGETLGTDLGAIITAANRAGATIYSVEEARKFLMTQVASKSLYTQVVFRAALVMTLALESTILAHMKFATQTQCRNAMLHVRDIFDEARAIGIDELDALIYQTMITMQGAITNHLAITELKLPRFVTYTMQIPMPSLYLAQRIYQDATRADEIETENAVIHPAFCPVKLKVLSNVGREDRFGSEPA